MMSADQLNQEHVVQTSNQFEQDRHDTRNDLVDSIVGFVVSFGFFILVFIIFIVFELIGNLN
jgi:Fe2+ transport system protein B